MKKSALFKGILSFFLFASATSQLHAQDDSSSVNERPRAVHEFGFNTTFLLKQVFNLSNNTFEMLPYDLTYKRIVLNSALRFGLGATMNFTSSKTSISSNSTTPGPGTGTPIYTKAFTVFFRGGWEKQFVLDKRFTFYAGFDLAGDIGQDNSQDAFEYNNLPTSYNFSKTTIESSTIEAGGGPVAGISWMISKRLSLFTEMPLYAMYSHENTKTSSQFTQLDSFGNFIGSNNTQTETVSGTSLSYRLPVTIYLAVRF